MDVNQLKNFIEDVHTMEADSDDIMRAVLQWVNTDKSHYSVAKLIPSIIQPLGQLVCSGETLDMFNKTYGYPVKSDKADANFHDYDVFQKEFIGTKPKHNSSS